MIKIICKRNLREAISKMAREKFVEVYDSGYPSITEDPLFEKVFDRDICEINITDDGLVIYAEEKLSIDLLAKYMEQGLRPGWDEENGDIYEGVLPALQSIKDKYPEVEVSGFMTFYDQYEPIGCIYYTKENGKTVHRKPADYCAVCNEGPLTDDEIEEYHLQINGNEVFFCLQDCLDEFMDFQGLEQ